MEKQMSMYDYLNNDKIAVMNTAPVEEAVEKIEAEPVDYNTLNKAELITVIADKDNVINNYIDKIEHMEKMVCRCWQSRKKNTAPIGAVFS